MELTIDGQVAMITGGAGGIGSAIARELAKSRVFVHVVDSKSEGAEAVAREIASEGGRAESHVVDVSDGDEVKRLFNDLDASGPPDILVNAAGVIEYAPFSDLSEEALLKMVRVNLIGTYLLMKEAARRMAERGSGRIVNIASTASFVAPRLEATGYSMTKGGVRQLTVAAAAELAPHGILVNAVAPGTTDTAFVNGTLDSPSLRQAAGARVPVGRIAEATDIVGPVLFLLSPLSSFICGQVLVVDGGQLARS